METEKIISDQYNSLPPEIKESISKVPWKKILGDIARRESLRSDQALALETETLLILYGFLPPGGYVQSIEAEVGVENEQAERITKLVSNEIFDNIERQYKTIKNSTTNLAPVSTAPTPTSSVAAKAPLSTVPMIEKNETAHDTTPEEKAFMDTPPPASNPITTETTEEKTPSSFKQAYPGGIDPYREPIE